MPRYVYIQRCEIYIYRIPIPFINELDTKALPPLHYTTKRICYPGVNINTNNEHMICCDCTDNCQDKTKCACCLLTAEVSRYKDFYGYVVVIIVVVVVIVIIIIVIVIVVNCCCYCYYYYCYCYCCYCCYCCCCVIVAILSKLLLHLVYCCYIHISPHYYTLLLLLFTPIGDDYYC